ncbi:hypothetical protein GL272_22115 [Aeromonas veronii]|uniref:hypothetical protein n=1 Tax=Aeromonas veronii TaxID=654 RepID=UPI001C5BB29A|nr:hypothetical protein [Aeromonas veronii]MBW3779569.1 hypothetical protein [Aeromonas veronii]
MKKSTALIFCSLFLCGAVSSAELLSVNKVYIADKAVLLPTVLRQLPVGLSQQEVCVSYITAVKNTKSTPKDTGKYTYETGEYCGKPVIKYGAGGVQSLIPNGFESLEWVPTSDGKAGVHLLNTFLDASK